MSDSRYNRNQLPVAPVTVTAGAVTRDAAPTLSLESDVAFVKLDFAVLESKRLTHCDKLVYCGVLSFGGFSKIDPSESQIAERCNVSHRQVRNSLHNLQKMGFLVRDGRVFRIPEAAAIAANPATTAAAANAGKAATISKKRQPLPRKEATAAPSIDTIDSSIEDRKTPAAKNAAVDERHADVAQMFQGAWCSKNPGFDKAPWGPREAGMLARVLKNNPGWKPPLFAKCIANWLESETNHAEMPVANITKFAGSPLDKYSKPKPKTPEQRRREQYERFTKEAAVETNATHREADGPGVGIPAGLV